MVPGPSTGADPSTLSQAIAAAMEGDVIDIKAGTYRERLILTRAITLQAWPPVHSRHFIQHACISCLSNDLELIAIEVQRVTSVLPNAKLTPHL